MGIALRIGTARTSTRSGRGGVASFNGDDPARCWRGPRLHTFRIFFSAAKFFCRCAIHARMGIEAAAPVTERISDGLGPMERWGIAVDLPETVDEIVQRVCEGERLKVICKSKGWPYSVVAQWVAGNEKVQAAYEGALRIAADEMAQETVEIADGATPETVGVDKHRTEVRMRLAEKLHRDRYGAKVQVEKTVSVEADAGLIGLARDLLNARIGKIGGVTERVIEHNGSNEDQT